MALSASTVWEVRTTGNAANGGGYVGGGTDYSQQDAAQLSLTDLACLDTSTTLTSVTGGFTAAMVGNIIYIASGTQFTVGYYEIKTYVDTNTITLDSTAAVAGQNATAGSGKVGGGLRYLTPGVPLVAGMKWWVQKGTYTQNGIDFTSTAGTNLLPYVVEGYDTTRGDNPTGTNRPLITLNSGYYYSFGSYWKLFNMSFYYASGGGGYPYQAYLGANSLARNCKFESNDFFGYNTLTISGGNWFIDCEFKHRTNGTAHNTVMAYGTGNFFHGCLFVGSTKGVYCAGSVFNYCIFSGAVTQAIDINGIDNFISNCVFYSCGKAVNSNGAAYQVRIVNSIILTCTVGLSCSASSPTDFYSDYNNFYDNGTDVTNVIKGPNDTAANPSFTDAANGNFSLAAGSGCIDAAFSTRLAVG